MTPENSEGVTPTADWNKPPRISSGGHGYALLLASYFLGFYNHLLILIITRNSINVNFVDPSGIEPLTSSMPWMRSTN